MKQVKIKYNPYLVETVITIDGQKPKPNSALNAEKKRLQEWVEKLPQIIYEEYRDATVSVEFTGTISDYEDVKAAFDAYKGRMAATCIHIKTADIDDVENTIDDIFKEIQTGPIPELRDQKIVDAFQKAKNSRFEINVVATMSSGKSTLINALLGMQIMPAANEATTATIVKIVDTEQDHFSAIAYDKSGQIVSKTDKVTLEKMISLNKDIKVSTVELRGKIPFVSSVGMKLVLVDTPGPNNSRDKRHEEMTYKMISDSDKSLVLYVMNGQQLGINDEKIFLDYVCQSMKNGGKQARERFIFAVNKMDAFNPSPKKDGTGCIERALNDVKKGLEDRGIYNPNIFPVCALPALELRDEDPDDEELELFKSRCEKYDELQFDQYFSFNNLPQTVRQRIEALRSGTDEDGQLEIHTGIVSIEQAIAQYINKYARTTKVCDLVLSFNEKLNEMSAVAHLEEAIRKDKTAKAALEQQIAKIKDNIESARKAQTQSRTIDGIDLKSAVEKDVRSFIDTINTRISKLLSGHSNKVEKKKAMQECQELEKECKAIAVQIKVQIDKILDKAYKDTINSIIDEYKKYLAELNIGVNSGALTFNAANLVSGSLADLTSIINDNTETADESYTVRDSRRVRKEGGFLRKTASFLTFGLVDDYTMETEYFDRKVAKYVDYVDMNEVATDYITPFQKGLKDTQKSAIDHVVSETQRLKEHLKGELKKIDKVLNEKLDALSRTEADSKAKAEEIAKKENNLKWLENIQKKVNNIINF